jgi:heme/copper-type cytochrome/quinol oxidase subunit 1
LAIKIFINRNIKLLTMIFALLSGISFIISLGYQSYGWTSYPPLAALGQDGNLTSEFFHNVFTVLVIFVSIIICIIIFLCFKRRSTAANIGLPKA